jgi:UDP-N-acetyl-D-mannosaminuronic acid dehydrogenase
VNFVTGECIIASSSQAAEFAKLTENSFRDVNIAFANELSLICDRLNIDVWELISLANLHPRVNILQPGPGVGGHCIAVDPWFIVSSAPDLSRLIRTAREVNDDKPAWVLEKVNAAVGAHLMQNASQTVNEVTIAIYGLAFKPDIDDLRESPAFKIALNVSNAHAGPLIVVEPHLSALPQGLNHAKLVNFETAASKGDIHLMLVDHRMFRGSSPPAGILVDTRGIWQDRPQKP